MKAIKLDELNPVARESIIKAMARKAVTGIPKLSANPVEAGLILVEPPPKRTKNPKGMSKTEALYYRMEIEPRLKSGEFFEARYEGLTFRLKCQHRYTPDWVCITREFRVECHEVKGSFRLQSYGRSRLAFDQAKSENPWFRWVFATKSANGWVVVG